jgi:hypothetical protein
MNNYSIIIWHNNDLHGKHQSILLSARTLPKLMRDFELYMKLPAKFRSFNDNNLVQLFDKDGHYHDIINTNQGVIKG